ncbi:MAG: UvrD-helicase domain-containing protein [Acutalibacteraceae bacterium]
MTEEDVTYLEDYLKTRDPAMQQQAERLCALRPAAPWSILAITFTNKAANELKARLQALLGDLRHGRLGHDVPRCLLPYSPRREIDRLDGYTGRFTIYDTSDSERVMKDILKDFGLDEKSSRRVWRFPSSARPRTSGRGRSSFPNTPESPAITAWTASRSSVTPNTKAPARGQRAGL